MVKVLASADSLGWERGDDLLRGETGVVHRFQYVGRAGACRVAITVQEDFDIYDVMAAYVKHLDTAYKVVLVSSGGSFDPQAKSLAADYGLPLISMEELHGTLGRQVAFVQSHG